MCGVAPRPGKQPSIHPDARNLGELRAFHDFFPEKCRESERCSAADVNTLIFKSGTGLRIIYDTHDLGIQFVDYAWRRAGRREQSMPRDECIAWYARLRYLGYRARKSPSSFGRGSSRATRGALFFLAVVLLVKNAA